MGLNTTPSCDSWSLELTGVRDVPWMAPPLSAPGLRKAPEATLDPNQLLHVGSVHFTLAMRCKVLSEAFGRKFLLEHPVQIGDA